jgi:hypothetical protein
MSPRAKIVLSFRIALTILFLGCDFGTLLLPNPYFLLPLPIFLAIASILSRVTSQAIKRHEENQ